MDIQVIKEVVGKINQELYDLLVTEEKYPTGGTDYVGIELWEECCLSFCGNWYSIGIKFLGEYIWSSEDDERNYIEETDEYEPLEDYLRRVINERVTELQKIKL